jgi:hypothetical protein
VYKLTSEGKELLNFAENSLNLIVKKIGVHTGAKAADETEQTGLATSCLLKKTKLCSAPTL